MISTPRRHSAKVGIIVSEQELAIDYIKLHYHEGSPRLERDELVTYRARVLTRQPTAAH